MTTRHEFPDNFPEIFSPDDPSYPDVVMATLAVHCLLRLSERRHRLTPSMYKRQQFMRDYLQRLPLHRDDRTQGLDDRELLENARYVDREATERADRVIWLPVLEPPIGPGNLLSDISGLNPPVQVPDDRREAGDDR